MTNVVLQTSDHGLGAEFDIAERGQFKTAMKRFLRHRLAMGSLSLLFLIVVIAFLGSAITPKHISYEDLSPTISGGPTNIHWFGTDNIGHDLFAQIQRGTQKSVQIAMMVAFFSTAFGVFVGALAGFYRGLLDSLLSRITDLVQTLPILVLLLVLLRRMQDQRTNSLLISLIIAGVIWPSTARVVRGLVLSLREKEFVEAARALGASDRRIIVRHLLPNCVGPIIVSATLTVAVAILLEASLSFLGFGVSAPEVSLGRLVDLGRDTSTTKPWLFYFPGLVLIIICLCVNFIGDGLRDALDPQQDRIRA